jgi:hypothetical protein
MMQKITSTRELKEAIKILEDEQALKEQVLREHFRLTLDSLRPVNLLKKAFRQIASPEFIYNDIIGTSIGLASVFLSRKLFVGTSGSPFRKIIGSFLQVGVATFISRNAALIKTIGKNIIHSFFSAREANAGMNETRSE